nr:MAG: ORF1 [TTV-like mini virus]
MPYWRRKYYQRRRNYFWRRPRKYFRRRYWGRRRWVRKKRQRKLKKFNIKQYNPRSVRKSRIRGFTCLFQCNAKKISFNFQMYEQSLVPEHLPGGGGFSIKSFSLQALFDEHELCHNFWSHGNTNLPLVKYLGCTFKLYQSYDVDYVFAYQNNLPIAASVDTYCQTQPSMLMMTKHAILVPSKKTEKRKKPYIKVRARPPTQFQTKWYFSQDLANTPLIMTLCSAASFDNYYTSTKWDSTSVNIITLKPGLFTNTNFKNYGTGYSPTTTRSGDKVYLYASETHPKPTKNTQVIYLGNTRDYKPGLRFDQTGEKTWDTFKLKTEYWGNPFYKDYISGEIPVYTSTLTPATMYNTKDRTINADEITLVESMTETLRYTPTRDTGKENQIYFKSVTKYEDSWNPPTSEKYINNGFPLYILCWGFPDFQRNLGSLHNLETEHALVIQTNTTFPIRKPIIPISPSFIKGNSPFEDSHNPLDDDRWYPCLQYQHEQINTICQCGPGTPKLNGKNTVEAKALYTFYFKFGGTPPPMSWVDNPEEQIKYPIPNNKQQTTSLQSPGIPLQTFLYNFDTKRYQLTKKAADRLKTDWSTKKTVFTDGTRKTSFTPEIISQKTPEETTSEEEEEENLLQLLQQQHSQQRDIRLRIKQLIKEIKTIE